MLGECDLAIDHAFFPFAAAAFALGDQDRSKIHPQVSPERGAGTFLEVLSAGPESSSFTLICFAATLLCNTNC